MDREKDNGSAQYSVNRNRSGCSIKKDLYFFVLQHLQVYLWYVYTLVHVDTCVCDVFVSCT